jgi:hypothetical protein
LQRQTQQDWANREYIELVIDKLKLWNQKQALRSKTKDGEVIWVADWTNEEIWS